MKILFVIPTLGTGGAERVASILANTFVCENEVEFLVLEKSTVDRYTVDSRVGISEAGIEVKRGNKLRAIVNYAANIWKQRSILRNMIDAYRPDAVLSILPKADILTYTVRRKCDFLWIPSECNDPMARSGVERCILNSIYRRAGLLVCQTKKVADYYEQQGVKRTCVIRNPLILKDTPDVQLNVPKHYFIAVGRLDKQKNFGMLISAFAQAVKQGNCPDQLFILGEGPEREQLSKLIDKLGVTDRIILMGRVDHVNSYLKRAKAFIMSSNYEGLPNAMLEAMATGLPVISTDYYTGAAQEFIDEENGIIVPVGDQVAMVDAILRMATTEKEKLLAMGEASRVKVKPLAVERICGEWIDTIQKEFQR